MYVGIGLKRFKRADDTNKEVNENWGASHALQY